MTREQLDALETLYSGYSNEINDGCFHIPELIAMAKEALDLRESLEEISRAREELRTYSIRPMPIVLIGQYFCANSTLRGLCFNNATCYIVATPPKGRASLYRRCAKCAASEAKRLGILLSKPHQEPTA